MASERAVTAALSTTAGRAPSRVRRNRFYLYRSVALALLVFAGFAPTVFLRGMFFDVRLETRRVIRSAS